MPALRSVLWFLLLGLVAASSGRAETLPPKPRQHFNDYAGLIQPQIERRLNARLEQFERETSNQFLVAIYPRMETQSSVEDYTVRIAESWGAGQKKRDNGVVLFVFVADRQLYIQVGYGLEGALTDALCHTIIETEIKPRFRAGDYAGGLEAAIDGIIAATRGEYKGTGRLNGARASGQEFSPGPMFIFFGFILFMAWRASRSRRTIFQNRGRRWHRGGWGGPHIGGGWGGGGFGGGGGFSGGGGSFGGGGAGGRW